MTTILIVAIIAAVAYYIYYLSHGNHEQAQTEPPRLDTYDEPLPEFKDDALTSSPQIVIGGGDDDAKVQMLEHFCLVDHGYHVTVWPKD